MANLCEILMKSLGKDERSFINQFSNLSDIVRIALIISPFSIIELICSF